MGQKMAQAIGGAGGGPPALPGAGPRYYLGVGGRQVGPLDLGALQAEVDAGRLSRDTLVWKDGMAAWEPAEKVAEVAALFREAGPPPLPKA
jgi:hypothetical protein